MPKASRKKAVRSKTTASKAKPAAKPDSLRLTELGALERAAECLKALAHPHRLRMVQMLLQKDFAVGELAEACSIPSHMASEHLRLMQRCGFLSAERDGRRRYYRVAEPHLASILACVETRFGVEAVRAAS
ncbi:putative HTH-type transcriptional regulator [Pseudobythopirellula maris]|uniref:Putative HTH-type transcriptional regulator n=1 Tax=Pseudobythopirellula maris TaxID=2527991 RepID=A0A5C5ZLV3_9BACT|nr:metalloregulator ArsR/SmtB family transcription factor [Pseudobythopirellula maris]TWT88379.1 putative HTH-type transcriptional regulator [Pseudobythopirellula maris]